jgi:hypothetical protein
MTENDNFFYITITTIITGLILNTIRQLYKCKCTKVKLCCNLIDLERNIQLEEAEDLIRRLSTGTINTTANRI